MRTAASRGFALLSSLVVLIVVPGCSDESGEAGPTSQPVTTPPSTSGAALGGALAGLVACDLLTAADVKQFGVTKPGKALGELGGAGTNGCQWARSSSPSRSAMAFSIGIRPGQGIDSVDIGQGTVTDGDFEGRPARQLREHQGPGDCMLAISVGKAGRVDVGVNDTDDDTDNACEVVNKIATIIEPKLPEA